MSKKMVITGASGFVGRQLVPRLRASGCELLLVGRSPSALKVLFPDVQNCSYEMISEVGRDFDVLVHLAVLNNHTSSSESEFTSANVALVSKTLNASKQAGIKKFVNITTFHALDDIDSEYAKSKRAALSILESEIDIDIVNIFLPAVHGDDFAGKLALVQRFPEFAKLPAFKFFSAFMPTVHIDRLSDFIVSNLDHAPRMIMLYNSQDENSVYLVCSRMIDLLFSIAVIVFAGWLLVGVWVLVLLGSAGPGIFAQKRVGRNGKHFICYKFRTMKIGTAQVGTHEVTADAITRLGSFLRNTKIDELPQVWNILRGELSLVGPRPGLPVQTALVKQRQIHGVFSVLPGITGLAQIKGIDMSDPERLARVDAQYIAQRGLLLDLKIIIATFLGRGQGDKVLR